VLQAYAHGLFPMAESREGPIEWFSPDPRAVFQPARVHLSRSLRRAVRRGRFEIGFNRSFDAVVAACAERPET
jgi:leucyl/phenylalanyl-tRNA--protein transferase